jgi:hypothetical protein
MTQYHMPRIIAICGAKRVGKDLLANYICEKYEYKKIAFADPLKQCVKGLFNFSADQVGDSHLKDQVDERWGITPRKALQFFGTEVLQYKMQEMLPDVGRKFLAYSLVANLREDVPYVISDMRFLHEFEEIKKLGAFVIRVDRPGVMPNTQLLHTSEVSYREIPFDLYMLNDADISDYINKFDFEIARRFGDAQEI